MSLSVRLFKKYKSLFLTVLTQVYLNRFVEAVQIRFSGTGWDSSPTGGQTGWILVKKWTVCLTNKNRRIDRLLRSAFPSRKFRLATPRNHRLSDWLWVCCACSRFLINHAVYKYAVAEINIFAAQCLLWFEKSEQSGADFQASRRPWSSFRPF